jgi:hypothetical protein
MINTPTDIRTDECISVAVLIFGRVLTALEGRRRKAVQTNVQDEWSL